MAAQTAKPAQLSPRTLEAFDAYIHSAEKEMERTLRANGPFLWSQQTPARAQEVRRGKVVAQFWSGQGPVQVPSGGPNTLGDPLVYNANCRSGERGQP